MTPMVRQVWVWGAAVITVCLTAALGVWQLDRADQKAQAHAQLLLQESLTPLGSGDWPCGTAVEQSLPVQRQAVMTGHWLPARTVWLENRPQMGQSGFEVVTPLVLQAANSPCDGEILLVLRGWVPRDLADRTRLPALSHASDVIAVKGRVIAQLNRVYALGDEPLVKPQMGSPMIRQNADTAFWQAWLGRKPVAGALMQTSVETPESGASTPADPLRRDWLMPGSGRDRHLGYAVQWFALSALAAALLVWFQLIRPRLQTRTSQHVSH